MSNVTNKDVDLAKWTKLARKEIKILGVKDIPSDLAFLHAWEFGNTARAWALWLSDAEKKKTARQHNRPAGPASNSNGMEV